MDREEDQELWERYGIPPASGSASSVEIGRGVLRSPKWLILSVLLAVPIWVVLEFASAFILVLLFRFGHELPDGLLIAVSPVWLVLMASLAFWLALVLMQRWMKHKRGRSSAQPSATPN